METSVDLTNATTLPGLLQNAIQHPLLGRSERRIALRAWPHQRDALVQGDAPVLDEDHAVGQGHGFLHVVRHAQCRETVARPQALRSPCSLCDSRDDYFFV